MAIVKNFKEKCVEKLVAKSVVNEVSLRNVYLLIITDTFSTHFHKHSIYIENKEKHSRYQHEKLSLWKHASKDV